jgi:hypothetical protein
MSELFFGPLDADDGKPWAKPGRLDREGARSGADVPEHALFRQPKGMDSDGPDFILGDQSPCMGYLLLPEAEPDLPACRTGIKGFSYDRSLLPLAFDDDDVGVSVLSRRYLLRPSCDDSLVVIAQFLADMEPDCGVGRPGR